MVPVFTQQALEDPWSVWPEGADVIEQLRGWCIDEGVPPSSASPGGHRPKMALNPPQTFAVVTRPIAPGSSEWKSVNSDRKKLNSLLMEVMGREPMPRIQLLDRVLSETASDILSSKADNAEDRRVR